MNGFFLQNTDKLKEVVVSLWYMLAVRKPFILNQLTVTNSTCE
jgi:hypothetical protein